MQLGTLAVCALFEIKTAVHQFESGEENAIDTVAKILELCKAVKESVTPKSKAA
jgi:hypothetical protein